MARCPFCEGVGKRALVARDRNREITDERFLYDRCEACGTVFLTNPPADLSRYYGGGYYGFRPDGEADWQGNEYLVEFQSFRLELLAGHVAPGALIEIGAGTGAFASAAKRAGYDVAAIEMDERSCRYIADRLGVRAINSERPVEVLPTLGPARVVALWHVLEHLPNPAEVLAAAAERLEPGGILAIGVPNPLSLQFRLLRSRWAHLDAPRHLVLIPAPALIERAQTLGLSCVELTTSDPFGRHCDLHGWSYALTRRPGVGPAPFNTHRGYALRRLASPLEGSGLRGSAVLILLRRDGSQNGRSRDASGTSGRGRHAATNCTRREADQLRTGIGRAP
jgi:SAM-dependent methyltransferase